MDTTISLLIGVLAAKEQTALTTLELVEVEASLDRSLTREAVIWKIDLEVQFFPQNLKVTAESWVQVMQALFS